MAVHSPVEYLQAINEAGSVSRRLAKYLLPVVAAAVAFNVPKFFEATIVYVVSVCRL